MRMYVLCDVDLIPLEQCPSGVFIRFESLGDGEKEKKRTLSTWCTAAVSLSRESGVVWRTKRDVRICLMLPSSSGN